jgi:hypothetical protein
MKIDLTPTNVIIGAVILLFLYLYWTDQGRMTERCEARGGHIVTIGANDRANDPGTDYCEFPNGGRIPVDELER